MNKEIDNNNGIGGRIRKLSENIKDTDIIYGKHDTKCAPGIRFNDGSCYSLDQLIEMADAWNKTSGKKIILHPGAETMSPSQYKKYLLKNLKKAIGNNCDSQKCWSSSSFIKNFKGDKKKLKKYTHRPYGPEGQFTWLNTMNINEVMEQYQKEYKDFAFIATAPMDFDTVPASYDNLPYKFSLENLNKLYNAEKTKFGAVFNLDKHNQSGSHWVAFFADMKPKIKDDIKTGIKKGLIYFFDSYGKKPTPEIRKLIRRFHRLMTEKGIKNIRVEHNKVEHQKGGSECGLYSIHFIMRMVKGEPFDNDSKRVFSDEYVNQMRDIIFLKVPNGSKKYNNDSHYSDTSVY